MNETNFICYLIDNCEGQCICEESLHEWYAEYLKSEQYISGRNSESPPLYEESECPECGGKGKLMMGRNLSDTGWNYDNCSECKGTGKTRKPIYYTPEAYEAWMHKYGQPEFKLGDDCAVWFRNILDTVDCGGVIEAIQDTWIIEEYGTLSHWKNDEVLVAIPGQSKPPVEG